MQASAHGRAGRHLTWDFSQGKLSPKTLPSAQRASLPVFRGLAGNFRDWTEVRQWADSIAAKLTAVAPGG
jgi:hypothetical protein